MKTNFNQAEGKYEYYAEAGNPAHYHIISRKGACFFEDIQKHLCSTWHNQPESPDLKRWAATLECLQSFLYQATKLAAHAKDLYSITPPPGQLIGHYGVEALTDFEALLYLARSALDRLTFAIAKQTYGNQCEKFDKLPNVLENYAKNDKRATHAKTVIEACLDTFQGILINSKDGKTGLRSLLAHSRSTGESLDHNFSIYTDTHSRVLRFDLELDRKGMLHTSWALNQKVPFLILNLVALYSGFNKKITLKDCEPTWILECVVLSSFLDPTNIGPIVSTSRSSACGFRIKNHSVRPEIFSHAKKT